MGSGEIIFLVFISLIVAVVLFFVFRAVMLWYYKINKRVQLLEENNFLLRKVAEALGKNADELKYEPPKE